jgi:hypothetical protein
VDAWLQFSCRIGRLRVIPDDEFGGCCFYLRFVVGDGDVFCLSFKGGVRFGLELVTAALGGRGFD